MSEDPANTPSTDLDELMQSAQGLLALQSLPRVGAKTAMRMLLTRNYDLLLESRANEWSSALAAADRQLDWCSDHDITPLSFFDERYPARLRAIHEPPPVLFIHGSLDAVSQSRAVAVVGTREPTSFGTSATDALVKALAEAHWVIVSGLARGIDTVAHGAALKHHTATVAVLAAGLDSIYPKENRELAQAIVDQGGALVSEQPIGARPFASSFVARNRIQSALSAAVMVMQTGVKGGTMHTARHAASQGRPIFCPVPHAAHERNEGLRVLLQQPGNSLCRTLPAWRDARSLCQRLGDWPLAHPIVKEGLNDVLAELEAVLPEAEEAHVAPWATSAVEEGRSGQLIVQDELSLFG